MEAVLYRLFLLTICVYFCWCRPTTEPSTTLAEPSQLDKVEAMLGNVQKSIVLFGSNLHDVKEDLKMVKTDFQTLKEDMNLMKADQQSMKADIDRIKTDLQLVKNDTSHLKTAQDDSRKETNRLTTDVELLKNDMSRMKRDQQDLKLEMDRFQTHKQSVLAQMDQMENNQQDLKNYLMQRDKAMEEKIAMSITTGTKKTQDQFQLVANFETLDQFRNNIDFRVISTRIPTVHQDCMEAYSDGWRKSGWYTINPDGKGNIDVYCEQEKAGGGWTLKTATDYRPKITGAAKIPPVLKDCQDAYDNQWRHSGVYRVSPDNTTEKDVYCDQELDGGGWTVFQRRINGEVDFYRGWQEYKTGFGNVSTEFWLGNDALYHLTKHRDQVLKIELTHPNGEVAYADYSQFYIDNEAEKYRLHVSGFSGANPPGDSFADYHSGMKFTSKDSDNDNDKGLNCANDRLGAWWYNDCHYSNLNGKYNGAYKKGINWFHWGNTQRNSMKETRMMIRKKK